eukprot:28018-Pelagomonas_calceolata.AAC.2
MLECIICGKTLRNQYLYVEEPLQRQPAQQRHPASTSVLQVVELEARGPLEFEYDPEWLAIMRSTNDTINLRHQHRCALRPGEECSGMSMGQKSPERRSSTDAFYAFHLERAFAAPMPACHGLVRNVHPKFACLTVARSNPWPNQDQKHATVFCFCKWCHAGVNGHPWLPDLG